MCAERTASPIGFPNEVFPQNPEGVFRQTHPANSLAFPSETFKQKLESSCENRPSQRCTRFLPNRLQGEPRRSHVFFRSEHLGIRHQLFEIGILLFVQMNRFIDRSDRDRFLCFGLCPIL